jgi:hypothetical protein
MKLIAKRAAARFPSFLSYDADHAELHDTTLPTSPCHELKLAQRLREDWFTRQPCTNKYQI